jgi:hypothetical protein
MDLPIAFNPASSSPAGLPFDLITAGLASGQFSETRTLDAWSLVEWDEFAAIVDKTFGGFALQNFSDRHATGFAVNGEVAVAARRDYYDDDWTIVVAAVTSAKADKWHAAMSAMLPAPPPPPPAPPLPDNIIPVAFWMQNSMTGGAYYRRRRITVQPWAEVEENYSSEARTELDALMALEGPGDGGKLILMHGPPGTGKTRSILSLFHAWKDWCSASVVTDSERFFGDPTYLNDLIFDYEGVAQWMLIVIEDGDEFIDVGQREHKGQAIARLLNMADGIVGQGLNLMTLITTNVPMERLNPALGRSGRCLADIHVGGFSEDDARTWLTAHDLDPDRVSELAGQDEIILADLYAMARADEVVESIEFADDTDEDPED